MRKYAQLDRETGKSYFSVQSAPDDKIEEKAESDDEVQVDNQDQQLDADNAEEELSRSEKFVSYVKKNFCPGNLALAGISAIKDLPFGPKFLTMRKHLMSFAKRNETQQELYNVLLVTLLCMILNVIIPVIAGLALACYTKRVNTCQMCSIFAFCSLMVVLFVVELGGMMYIESTDFSDWMNPQELNLDFATPKPGTYTTLKPGN